MPCTWITGDSVGRYQLNLVYPPGVKYKTCEVEVQFNLLIVMDSPVIKAEPGS